MKTKMRRIVAAFLSVLMIGTAVPALSITAAAATDFKAEGYTPIRTADELSRLVRQDLNGKYYLAEDIVFKASDFEKRGAFYNEGAGWLPLGSTYAKRFTGVFDGNGHTISGLKVSIAVGDSDSAYAGLFGYSSGKISNVTLLNASVQIKDSTFGYAGALVGAAAGTISHCYVRAGSVSVTNAKTSANAGGLVGRMYAGTISECYSSAAVSASGTMAVAGGLAAQSNATMSSVMNQGNATAKSPKGDATAGGIAGINDGTISNAVNKSGVQATAGADAYAGGLVGANRASLKQAVNLGAVKATAKSHLFGGAVAGQCSGGTLASCYYLNSTYNKAVSDSKQTATGLSTAQLADASLFAGLDFNKVWTIDKNEPALRSMTKLPVAVTGISITKQPKKTEYIEGQKLDTTGMVVVARYEDGTQKTLGEEDYVLTGYDNTSPGKKTLTISYSGHTATLQVTIAQKVLTGISIHTLPSRVVFGLGEELDVSGGLISAEYNNGIPVLYTMTTEMVSGYNNKKLGKQTLTVTFHGKKATFDITMQKDPPPTTKAASTTAVTGVDPNVSLPGGDAAEDPFDDSPSKNSAEMVTTRQNGEAVSGSSSSPIWVALVLVAVALLAAGGVVLFGMQRSGKLALHTEARHGKHHPLDQPDTPADGADTSPAADENASDSDDSHTPPQA